MRYAVIAAGGGSRLVQEGLDEPKPMIEVAGEPLIDRLIRIFMANGAHEIDVICNNITSRVSDHLRGIQRYGLHGARVPLRVVVKTTPSSMHSFYELSAMLQGAPFVLTTVDTVFREDEFARYTDSFAGFVAEGGVGLMGVTDYIDDEKPLYVDVDEAMNITAFLDETDHPRWISGGVYGLTPPVLDTLGRCVARGESRMRNFQRAMLADGHHLKAWPFTKVMDIDHRRDIVKAEEFVRGL